MKVHAFQTCTAHIKITQEKRKKSRNKEAQVSENRVNVRHLKRMKTWYFRNVVKSLVNALYGKSSLHVLGETSKSLTVG